MGTTLFNIWEAFVHVFFPSICAGCGSADISHHELICLDCHLTLPYTHFENIPENPIAKIFWGRVDVIFGSSTFYFIPKSPIQRIIHQIKYKNGKELGIRMGRIMGQAIRLSSCEYTPDICIPMPLHPKKEYIRGYNQASLLCEGIMQETNIAYDEKAVIRKENTSTQTKKSRMERWTNVEEVFEVVLHEKIMGKHCLIIDDVITTGASTEACAHTLLRSGAASVGIYSLAFRL